MAKTGMVHGRDLKQHGSLRTELRVLGLFRLSAEDEPFDEGFQSVPANWQISSDRKRSFFNLLAEMTTGTTED